MKNFLSKRIWIIPVAFVIILWIANLTIYLLSSDDDIGKFGDVFGAVNALFSGLAFVGIIISIRMQSSELKIQNEQLSLQSEELKLQREELKETRWVFEKQSNLMDDQRNDATFFNLLANHRQMIDSLRTSTSKSIGKVFGKKYGTIQEPVSGYEVVDGIAIEWIKYFKLYSKMYTTKEITDFENISHNPLDILAANTDLITILKEILNVYDFVNTRFADHPQKQFYKDTLWANLCYSEKFIFESYLFNYPGEQNSRNHKTDIYESYDFIDFKNCSIPEISVRTYHTGRDELKLKIDHNAKILKVIFFSFEHKYNENSAKVIQAVEIQNQYPELALELSINNAVISVNDQIDDIPYKESTKLAKYNYGILCYFIHKGEKFKVCFDVHLTSSCIQSPENETECRPIFNGQGIQSISDDIRAQIYQQMESKTVE